MLDLRLLGPVRLLRDGSDVALGRVLQRATLAVLALNVPRVTSTDFLVDALWADDPPTSARNSIQVYISGLRRAVGRDVTLIERVGDGYRLVGEGLTIDTAEVETKVAEGRAALMAGGLARAERLLGDATQVWSGHPLQGFEHLPFHGPAAARLTDLRALALIERADTLLLLGRPDDAATAAADAVLLRAFDERAWAVLASAEYHAGRPQQALATVRRINALLAEQLGLDPTPALVDLEARILRHDLPMPESPARAPVESAEPGPTDPPLPTLVEPFLGREALVSKLIDLLETTRLITLVGLGGIGKTTVATAVVHHLAGTDRPGYFCDLGPERSAAGALERICRTLGFDAGDDPLGALAQAPVGAVVVLDNAEQIDGFGRAVSDIIATTPLTALVTSRRSIRARDEHVIQVGPLAVDSVDGTPSAAAGLFLSRAAQVRPLDPAAAAAAGEICRLLDGIPLAIELAAGRTRVLTVRQLADRLAQGRLPILAPGRRSDLAERRSSLSAILEATLELLDAHEAALLENLASFVGWTTLDTVESVLGTRGPDFLDQVEELVEAGLAETDAGGRIRLRPPVRDFALPRGDREQIDLAVLVRAAQIAEAAGPSLLGPDAPQKVSDLEADHDFFAGAMDLACQYGAAAPAATLALALNRYWVLTGRIAEGLRQVVAARAVPGHSDLEAARMAVLEGTFASYLNDPTTVPLLAEALPRAEALGAPLDRLLVNGWCCLAAVVAHQGDAARARSFADQAAAAGERSGRPELIALARDLAGHVAAYAGDHSAALTAALGGLEDARRSGDHHDLVSTLIAAAESALHLGRLDDAESLSGEAFELSRGLSGGLMLGAVLMIRGAALTATGKLAEARGCLTQSLRILRDSQPDPFQLASVVGILAAAAAIERSDRLAARLYGAARALYADVGGEIGRLPAPLSAEIDSLMERLGPDKIEVLGAGAFGDPGHVVDELLS